MSLARQLALLASAIILVAAAWFAEGLGLSIGSDAPAPDAAAPAPSTGAAPVVTRPVAFASDAAVVRAVGTGNAVRAITIHPEAAGQVVEILFDSGQSVEQGQPLVRLDEEEERLALELARIRLQDARQTLERYESVAPSGAVSASEVDTARTALSAARVEISQAELALANRTIAAPFAGVTGLPEVDPGDRVTEATPIAPLDDRSTILVDFEIPEAFAAGVSIGDPLEATTWALPGRTFEGTVSALGSRIDPTSRTLRVRALIPNEDDVLRTGMSFAVRLPLQGERYPTIPSIAVQWDREGAFVWRVEDDIAKRVRVRVLKRSEAWVLVDAPLSAGDAIVVEGVQRLRPGMPVGLRPAESGTPTRTDDVS